MDSFGSPVSIAQVQIAFRLAGFGSLAISGPDQIEPFPPVVMLTPSAKVARQNNMYRLVVYKTASDASSYGAILDPDENGITWNDHVPRNETAPISWSGVKRYGNVRLIWFPAAPRVDAAFRRLDAVLRKLVAGD
jgi:hypothetical protein